MTKERFHIVASRIWHELPYDHSAGAPFCPKLEDMCRALERGLESTKAELCDIATKASDSSLKLHENIAAVTAGIYRDASTNEDAFKHLSEEFGGQIGILQEIICAAEAFTEAEKGFADLDWYESIDAFVEAIVETWQEGTTPSYAKMAKTAIVKHGTPISSH